jgi:predicted DNA-binding transcriptional regulator YafY
MRRTERLFQIIQILRSTRAPVTGRSLANELEVSLRTLYRDMAELTAQQVPITGEAGTGYVLDANYNMPALMLTADELEVAALGAAWVASQGDASLATAARDLIAKLSDAIPQELRPVVLDAGSRPIAFKSNNNEQFESAELRRAIRARLKIQINYRDSTGAVSDRVIWPLLTAYTNGARYIVGWCEVRQDYRHFKTDRVNGLNVLDVVYPERRAVLIDNWQRVVGRPKSHANDPS